MIGPKALASHVLAVVSGIVIAAAAVLVILQWGNHANFSLYGRNYSIQLSGSQPSGGVNTALLMILSGLGMLVVVYAAKLLYRNVRTLRQMPKVAAPSEDAKKNL